jgi:hypothetical protein
MVSRDLAQAVAAYRAAQEALEEARTHVPKARDALAEKRSEMAEAIAEAYHSGMRQVEIIRMTGLSRERVRLILRAAGIEADD